MSFFIDSKNTLWAKGFPKDVVDYKDEYYILLNNVKSISVSKEEYPDSARFFDQNEDFRIFIVDVDGGLWFMANMVYGYSYFNVGYYKESFGETYMEPKKIDLNFFVVDVVVDLDWIFLLDKDGQIWKLQLEQEGYRPIKLGNNIFKSISCANKRLFAIDIDGNLWNYYDYDEDDPQIGQFGTSSLNIEPGLKQITSDIHFVFVYCSFNSINAIDIEGNLYISGLCQFLDQGIRKVIQPVNANYCDETPQFQEITKFYLKELTKLDSKIKFKYLSIGQFNPIDFQESLPIYSLFIDNKKRLWTLENNSQANLVSVDLPFKIISAWVGGDGFYFKDNKKNLYYTENFQSEIIKVPLRDDMKVSLLPNEKPIPTKRSTKSARKIF